MKMTIDIVENGLCNYDGRCQICDNEHGFGWCYGNRYETKECPLIDSRVEISLKPYFKDKVLRSEK